MQLEDPIVPTSTSVDNDDLLPTSATIFSSLLLCPGIGAQISHQNVFLSRTRLLPEQGDGYMLMWCLYCLQLFEQMNAPLQASENYKGFL